MAKQPKMVPCSHCGESVKQTAFTCPNCGINNPGMSKNNKLIFKVGMGVVVLIVAGFLWFGKSSYTKIADKSARSLQWERVSTKHDIVKAYINDQSLPKSAYNALYPCISEEIFTQPGTKMADVFSYCRNIYNSNKKHLASFTDFDIFQGNFSATGGQYYPLEKLIKSALNDADSYDHMRTIFRIVYDDQHHPIAKINTAFTAKNDANGTVQRHMLADVDIASGRIINIKAM